MDICLKQLQLSKIFSTSKKNISKKIILPDNMKSGNLYFKKNLNSIQDSSLFSSQDPEMQEPFYLESRLVLILSNFIWFISKLYFSYHISDHLPRYLWGPPPPYSQPPSIENIREASEINADLEISGSAITGNNNPTGNPDSTGNSCPLSLPVQPNSGPASVSGSARTTRSGLLQNIKGPFMSSSNNLDYRE